MNLFEPVDREVRPKIVRRRALVAGGPLMHEMGHQNMQTRYLIVSWCCRLIVGGIVHFVEESPGGYLR